MTTTNREQLEMQLRAKPSLEAAQAQYQSQVESMSAKVASLVPGLTWQIEKNTWIGCGGDYANTPAKQAYVMAVFSGPIPDSIWPQTLKIVRDSVAQQGVREFGTFQDAPGNHDVYIAGADGVEFRLATQKAATLTAKSDCRLSEADKGSS
ncbi:MAG: LppA family lipoprotein [Mycobacterium kyogaense]|uniref:LppA family lipoprotein n=1 Tax=Mycobacterium kyogaense TaxID=2212479 RepID=UPI002FFA4E1A